MNINYLLYYHENNKNDLVDTRQWDDESAMSVQHTEGLGREKSYYMDETVRFPFPGIKNLGCQMFFLWRRKENVGFNRQVSDMAGVNTDYRHEYQDASTTEFAFEPKLTYDRKLWKRLHLFVSERCKVSGDKSVNDLFVLSGLDGWGLQDSVAVDLVPSNRELLWHVYDPVNSTYSNLTRRENEFALSVKLNKSDRMPFDVTLNLPLYMQHEKLDYRRDVIDTLARRNMFAFHPSLQLKHKDWFVRVGLTTFTPGLMRQMPYRDARNPLNIIEGNPSLKNNRRVNASMKWKHKIKGLNTGDNSPCLASEFAYHIRSVAQGFTYNTQTGAYTFRPENVEGNWSWNNTYDFTFALDGGQKWWVDSRTKSMVWHSVDYTSVSGVAGAQLNKVETVNLDEDIKVRYIGKAVKATFFGNVCWRHTWGYRLSQETISAFDYHYGMTAGYTLPAWKTTFNVDASMYSRRGYNSELMNRDEWVVNASVVQPLMHGRMTLTLEGCDLFHQRSNTAYEVNAQGRTESWHRVIPNYVMLHIAYNFNSNTKQ